MAENTTILRTTTIGLDEYNLLKTRAEDKQETIGALNATIDQLRNELSDKEKTEPSVKVIHYDRRYNPYSCEEYDNQSKYEFCNLADVQNLIRKEVEKDHNNILGENKQKIREYKDTVDTLQEVIDAKDRTISKHNTEHKILVQDLRGAQAIHEKDLNKAYDKDVKEYKDTIKELKEEIQKVKDGKTDLEIEEKRNKEIKDLKGRIRDLERILENVNHAPFFKRWNMLRKLEVEQNKAAQELLQKERDADRVGTTWVKEGGKIRNYGAFGSVFNSITSFYIHNFGKGLRLPLSSGRGGSVVKF